MRLKIKETDSSDLKNIMVLWNHPEVMHFVGFPNGLGVTLSQMEAWYDRLLKNPDEKHWSIYQDTRYAGETFYRLEDNQATMDIKLLPWAHRQGIASAALSFAIYQALNQPGIEFAKVDPVLENVDAITLYNKLGFQAVEGSLDRYLSWKDFKPSPLFIQDHLKIRKVRHDELKQLWEISAKENDYPWVHWDAPYFEEYQPESYEDFVKNYKDRAMDYGIVFDGKLIGSISSYWEDKRTRWIEFGLILYNDYFWNKGIAEEVNRQYIQMLFDAYPEIERVGCTSWSKNMGMIRSAQKAGLKLEARLRKTRYWQNEYHDSVRLGITRTEWERFKLSKEKVRFVRDPDQKASICRKLLDLNPHHFGIESSKEAYVKDAITMEMLVVGEDEALGFISLNHHAATSEVHCMAIHPDFHRQGYGQLLLDRTLYHLRQKGTQFLLVKTLDESHPDPYYAKTRLFYQAYGFTALEVSDRWGDENPCLELIYPV